VQGFRKATPGVNYFPLQAADRSIGLARSNHDLLMSAYSALMQHGTMKCDIIRTPRKYINIPSRTRTNESLGIFTRPDVYSNRKESWAELSAERRDRLNISKQIENIPRADPLKFPAKRIDPRQPAELPAPRSSD